MNEERLNSIEEKLDMLFNVISEIDSGERRNSFHEKWKDKIAEIEPNQKAVFGDSWNEEDGLWDYHEKHSGEEGYDEDKTIGGYLDSVKQRFADLKEKVLNADVPSETKEEITEMVEDAEKKAVTEPHPEDAVEIAEDAVDQAIEEAPASNEEEEVREALKGDILLGSVVK